MRKGQKKAIIIDVIILVIVAVALAISMAFSRSMELALGLLYPAEEGYDGDDVIMIDPRNSARADLELDGLGMYYLDVGQGDCTIITLPDGKTMIIDAAKDNNKNKTAIQTFINTTFDENFKYFDYAILTHPDEDHCGSMDDVLNQYPARISYRPNVEAVGTAANPYVDPGKTDLSTGAKTKNTAAYAASIKAMYTPTKAAEFTPEVRVTDPANLDYDISGGSGDDAYTFTFYSPLSKTYTDWNDYSPIMILSYRGYNFAFSGDAEKKNEQEFVARVKAAPTDGVTDKYDIFTDSYTVNSIKCGHHGSRTSTSLDYINAITTPEGAKSAYYIVSCGPDNSYGHPHAETFEKLDSLGVPESSVLRTDTSGTLTLSVRADESGEYKLYNGDVPSASTPIDPDNPDNPDNPDKPDPDPIKPDPTETEDGKVPYVYAKMGNIKLTWPVVAWISYAALVVVALVHILLVYMLGVTKANKAMRGGRKR